MAAILECLLLKQVPPAEIIKWLAKKHDKDERASSALEALCAIRGEFVAYFLNFLRDQTAHLQSVRSANTTPAKSPLVATGTPTPARAAGRGRAASRLFASPANAFTGCDDGGTVDGAPDCGHGRRPAHRLSYSPTTQQSEPAARGRHLHSLSEFIAADGRRTGGRTRGEERRPVKTEEPSPVFSLADKRAFPSLSTTPERVPSLPSGVRVITKSRRVTTTSVTPSKSSHVDSVFQTAPLTGTAAPPRCQQTPAPSVAGGSEQTSKLDLLQQRLLATRISEAGDGDVTPRRRCGLVSGRAQPAEGCGHDAARDVSSSGRVVAVAPLSPPSPPDDAGLAQPGRTTHGEQLRLMAQLYAGCILENLVPNVTVEICFVVQLLTVTGIDTSTQSELHDDADDVTYFDSIHNVVFFAVMSLQQLERLLSLLDRATLRLLADHQRVAHFLPQLAVSLRQMQQHSTSKVIEVGHASPICNVAFQADTDNRNNFPNDNTFHLFKKQRDVFYEVIREWSSRHLASGWSAHGALEQRVRWLTSPLTPLTNHLHFVRLFRSQLIRMCKGDESVRMFEDDDKNVDLLAHLKLTNPSKFKRLQERFVTPSRSGGACPPPGFPGCQELFRDFIVIASSATFNQHLLNSLVAHVSELNSVQFLPPSDDPQDEISKKENRATLFDCLATLRLLGKFLGFVTFLPHRSAERLPESLRSSCVSTRNLSMPPIDLLAHLECSLVGGSTVLTVPWLVEFLSMMDDLAPQLTYFSQLLVRLLEVHRMAGKRLLEQPSHSALLLVLTLGWLFELPVLPEGFFFRDMPTFQPVFQPKDSLDSLDLVDQRVLFACCPYLGEVRNVLVDSAIGAKSRTSNIRKITPVSTQTQVSAAVSETQLKRELEENFFHNQPSSLKRAVEFVSERVASNYVKKFRAEAIPRLLAAGCGTAGSLVSQHMAARCEHRSKERIVGIVQEEAAQVATRSRLDARQQAHSYCEEKMPAIMASLLPEEVAPPVLSVSTMIAQRGAEEKVDTWLTTYVTCDFFKQEFLAEFEKQLRNEQLRSVGKTPLQDRRVAQPVAPPTRIGPHDDTCTAPADMLIAFKETLLRALGQDKRGDRVSEICLLLTQTKRMFAGRKDIVRTVYQSIGRMSIDLAYTTVCGSPEQWTSAVQELAFTLWTTDLREYVNFTNVICQKHITIISSQTDSDRSWSAVGQLLTRLLDNNLLLPSDLAASVLKMSTLSQAVSEQLATCVRAVVGGVGDSDTRHLLQSLLQTLDASTTRHDASPSRDASPTANLSCRLPAKDMSLSTANVLNH